MSSGLPPRFEWLDAAGPHRRLPHQRTLLELAVQRRPDSERLHRQLGEALLRDGAHEEAVRAFTRALELAPHSADAAFGLGCALAESNRIDAAIAQFRLASRVRPDHPETHVWCGRALARAGCTAEALAELRQAVSLAPAHYEALRTLTRVLIQQRDYQGVRAACDTSLARAPGNAAALALKSQALCALGDDEAARQLLDVDRFVQVSYPALPEYGSGSESLLDALERSVRANPGHEFEPEHRTARGGSRADLQPSPDGPEAVLRELIKSVAQDYLRSFAGDTSHPFCAAAPIRGKLVMWTNILSEGGYHTPHVHPAAWLSGVYYVKVPGGGADQSGILELGCADPLFDGHANPRPREVLPRAGMLVLFPSYFYHRTRPTRSREERISVAFDLIAAS